MPGTRRYLGLLAVLFALAANWLLPVLHAPCNTNKDHPEHCCAYEHGEHADRGQRSQHQDATPNKHTHRDDTKHDESRCGLCQIMFMGTLAHVTFLNSAAFCGVAPRIAIISIASQRAESCDRPRHLAPRGPPAA